MTDTPAHKPDAPRPRLSLRFTIALWSVAVFATIQIALGLVLFFYQRAAIDRFFDGRLAGRVEARAESLAGLPAGAITDETLAEIVRIDFRFSPPERVTLVVYNASGQAVASSVQPAPAAGTLGVRALPAGSEQRRRIVAGPGVPGAREDEALRVAAAGFEAADNQSLTLVAVASDAHAQSMLALAARMLLLLLPLSIAASAAAGWLIAGAVIRPVTRLRERVGALSPETLGIPLVPGAESAELARLEEELEAARSRLAAGFAAQERFMANISHEIKTPIATLLSEAQALTFSEKTTPAVATFVQSVQDEMRRLGRMVDSFLALTRVRSGATQARMRPYPVNDILMDSVEACAGLARERHVSIDPTLLDADADTRVEGDPDLLRTMMDNLVRNAIRFSPVGGRVEVAASVADTNIVIAVRDQGAGIPPDLLPRLFERPGKSNGEARISGRRHGLGLRIAQSVAELHGGMISASNLSMGGCEFRVLLPASGSSARPAPAATGV